MIFFCSFVLNPAILFIKIEIVHAYLLLNLGYQNTGVYKKSFLVNSAALACSGVG